MNAVSQREEECSSYLNKVYDELADMLSRKCYAMLLWF